MSNILLDKFKSNVKIVNTSFDSLYNEIVDIVDGDGFDVNTIHSTERLLTDLRRDVIRLINSSNELEEFVLNGTLFSKIKIKIFEINSGLQILKLASESNKKDVFNNYAEDMINILTRISDNILSYSHLVKCEDF